MNRQIDIWKHIVL